MVNGVFFLVCLCFCFQNESMFDIKLMKITMEFVLFFSLHNYSSDHLGEQTYKSHGNLGKKGNRGREMEKELSQV